MKIRYPNLLLYKQTVENIIKLTLERLSIGEAPFLSTIDNSNRLKPENSEQMMNLCDNVDSVIDFIRFEFCFTKEDKQWKDIRKHGIRNILLYNYVANLQLSDTAKSSYLLSLHLFLYNKKPPGDIIELFDDCFKIKHIHIPHEQLDCQSLNESANEFITE